MATPGKSNLKSTNKISLVTVQKEVDDIKLKVDDLCQNDLPDLKAASPERKKVFHKVTSLKDAIATVTNHVESLQLANESLPTATFNKKKDQEFKRLISMKDQIERIHYQLEPDETEEDYFRKIASDSKPKDKAASGAERQAVAKDEEESEVDNDEEETEDEYMVYQVQALSEFTAEEDGDLAFTKGERLTITETREDGWWLAENQRGKTGLVPSTLLKILDTEESVAKQNQPTSGDTVGTNRSGKDLWSTLRNSKNEVSVTDVLKAMKAVPTGFRNSTLGALVKEDRHRLSNWIVPKLSPSNVSFKDVFWDHVNKRLRSRPVKVTRSFSLAAARMIPVPNQGLEIKSRHARVALWNGKEILSNVHTVRGIPIEKDEMTWTFTPKVTRMVPSLYDGDGLVRIDSASTTLAILVELNYSYTRTSSGDKGETSIGWASVPLFENNGTPVPNKTYELNLNGGTPFERGVEVDPTITLQGGKSLYRSLVKLNRQPRVVVKLTSMSRLTKEQYDLLPDTIVTCQSYARFIGYYREMVASSFASSDRMKSNMAFDPVLSGFPGAADFPDLMDALKMTWDDKLRLSVRRSQRRNPAFLLGIFKQCYLESIFAIQQCAGLPPYAWANEFIEQERFRFILSFLESKNTLERLLSSDLAFKPLLAERHSFDPLSNAALVVPPTGQENIGSSVAVS